MAIKQKLERHDPALIQIDGYKSAAVALILRNLDANPEIFFIQRATNENDPWSGQIAFPGGNMDAEDGDVVATAVRETAEEVGFNLTRDKLLCRLDDQQGRNNYNRIPLIISCLVFDLGLSSQAAVHNQEVGDSIWVEVSHLFDANNRFDYLTSYAPDPYPAVQLPEGKVLWGLTFRFVQAFLNVVR